MRLSEKCAVDQCEKRWEPGVAYIRNSQTFRFCTDAHLRMKLHALPWRPDLFADSPAARDDA